METEPSPTSDHSRPRGALIAMVGAAAAVIVAAGALFVVARDDDGDTVGTVDEAVADPTVTTGEPTATTTATTAPAPPTTEAPADAVDPIDLSVWVGVYEWAEAVEGIGSDQFVVHRLALDAVTNSGAAITGELTQDGFQTATELRVRALPMADGIAVELVEVDRGKGIEVPGDVLFELSGDPAAPLTTLRELLTLRIDHPDAGTYFVPAAEADDSDDGDLVLLASFWAVEAETYDLVQADTSTGEVLRRVAGWGPFDDDDELGGQALVDVDAGPDGIVWVSDCCEPAVGGLFVVGPETTGIDAPLATALGVSPAISSDGALVAIGVLDRGVQISDARSGAVLTAAEDIGPLLGRPTADPGFAQPLAWINDRLLAVSISDEEQSTISFVDVALADGPAVVGEMTIGGVVRQGSVRADGNLVVLVDGADVQTLGVIDPIGAEVIDRGPVTGEVVSIDYDPSGRFLALLDADGSLDVVAPNGIVTEIPGRYVDVSW